MSYDLESKYKNRNKNELIDADNRLMIAGGRGWKVSETGEGGQNVQTSSYKIDKSWGCNIQHSD